MIARILQCGVPLSAFVNKKTSLISQTKFDSYAHTLRHGRLLSYLNSKTVRLLLFGHHYHCHCIIGVVFRYIVYCYK
jgi:hypothetical protein